MSLKVIKVVTHPKGALTGSAQIVNQPGVITLAAIGAFQVSYKVHRAIQTAGEMKSSYALPPISWRG